MSAYIIVWLLHNVCSTHTETDTHAKCCYISLKNKKKYDDDLPFECHLLIAVECF